MTFKGFGDFLLDNIWIIVVAFILLIAICCVICFCHEQFTTVPNNYIWCGLFTLCFAIFAAYACITTDPDLVFMAATMTLGVTVSLTVYAYTTDADFTVCCGGGCWFMLGFTLVFFLLFAAFTDIPIWTIALCSLIVLLFGFYIVYDTQLILGGKRF